MKIVKVTEKGQVTIPVVFRRKLGISNEDHLTIEEEGDCLKLRKVVSANPLGPEDPIWDMVGMAQSSRSDVSRRHDDYLAEGEIARWRKS